MTELETRLRRTLHDRLDPVEAEPVRSMTIANKARRARVIRAATATLALVALVAGTVAAAGVVRRTSKQPPAAPPPTTAVFTAELPPNGSARVAIETRQGQACYSTDVAMAVRGVLRRDDPGPDDPAVATFFETFTSYAPALCAPIGGDDASRVVATPELHYLEFDIAMDLSRGELEPLRESVEDAPEVAEIVCGAGGAVALTPLVQPQVDGVHLNVYNYRGERGEFYFVAPDGGNEIGRLPADDVHSNVSSFGPGALQIGCIDYAGNFSFDGTGSERHAELEIVDPEDLWNEPELECGDGRRRRVLLTDQPTPDRPGVPQPYEEMAREFVPGVEPGDVLERPRYPESGLKFETLTLIRDGRRIARLLFVHERPQDPVWGIWPFVCPGYGIADPEV